MRKKRTGGTNEAIQLMALLIVLECNREEIEKCIMVERIRTFVLWSIVYQEDIEAEIARERQLAISVSLWWVETDLFALLYTIEIMNRVQDTIINEVKYGTPDEKIIKIIMDHLGQTELFNQNDLKDMIIEEKANRLKYTLDNYYALGKPSMGIDYSKTYVLCGSPTDVSYDLVMKIAIDQAINHMKKYSRLKDILKMRYFCEGMPVTERVMAIQAKYNTGLKQVYQMLNAAVKVMVQIIEEGVSLSEKHIKQVIQLINHHTWFSDELIETIVREVYSELEQVGILDVNRINLIDLAS